MDSVHPSLRIAALISGSGSTLLNILQRIADGRLRGVEVCGVAASRDCPGLEHARAFGIPWVIVPRTAPPAEALQPAEASAFTAAFDAAEFSERLSAELDRWQPQLVVCAGFLSLYLPAPQYRHKVLNVHPALLPAFGGPGMYGQRVHEAVLASGAKVSGCTVHLTDEHYDSGPIIAQRTVAVLPDDTPETLSARVQAAERELYPLVLQGFADGRIRISAEGAVELDPRVLTQEPGGAG
ncbi:phosphoribosylglycinamide formyltransferase [bacterium]|nr:phosphoribosylglycinamide formyltransferase [bacterium]